MRRVLFLFLSLVVISSLLMSCGSTEKPTAVKVGEVEDTKENPELTEESEETYEVEETYDNSKTDFFVGETFKDSTKELTYLSSGEYVSDNQFIQPKEGYRYIFLKFYCKNISEKSDCGISYFDFDCFADGYSMDQIYSIEPALSASLSPGRSTEGYVGFEVPVDAKDIDIEYEVNIFTDKKIHFIYEGDKDANLEITEEVQRSEDSFNVGDIVETDLMRISYLSGGEFIPEDNYHIPEEGMMYIFLELECENISSGDISVSSYDFHCFSDGKSCDAKFILDEEELSSTLSSGRKTKGKVFFEVPKDAEIVEVEYDLSVWSSKKVVFTIR